MYKIVVVGIGNLGKRHVQSLLKSKFDMNIMCIDKSDVNFDEISKMETNGIKQISFYSDYNSLPKELDLVIIATSSAARREVFEKLIVASKVNNIIFEKVLFQREEDYMFVQDVLRRNEIQAWVNCARREWDSWRELKKRIEEEGLKEINIVGSNWGFACNSIHMLDLIHFFDPSIVVCDSYFEKIIPSKREGYKELFGSVNGKGKNCKHFSISCYEGEEISCTFSIATKLANWIVNEGMGKVYRIPLCDEQCNIMDFVIEYQSNLTHKSVEGILVDGKSNLPSYEEAMCEHLQLLKPMITYFEKNGGEKDLCPIT